VKTNKTMEAKLLEHIKLVMELKDERDEAVEQYQVLRSLLKECYGLLSTTHTICDGINRNNPEDEEAIKSVAKSLSVTSNRMTTRILDLNL
jgi:hypothetical protein